MSKQLGREITVERDSEPIANIRTKSMSVNREPVDFTDDDSSGWRELAEKPGQIEVSMSVEGVLSDDTLRDEALSTDGLKVNTLEYSDGGTVAGDFLLTSYEEEGTYNDVTTFSAELQGSGEITYTAAT